MQTRIIMYQCYKSIIMSGDKMQTQIIMYQYMCNFTAIFGHVCDSISSATLILYSASWQNHTDNVTFVVIKVLVVLACCAVDKAPSGR